jgi:hypothetical protein
MSRLNVIPPAHASARLPTVEQVQKHLLQHGLVPRSASLRLMPMGLLIGALLLGVMIPALVWLPAIALLGVVGYGLTHARRQQRLSARVQRVSELILLGHPRMALRSAWKLLPAVRHDPSLHTRIITAIGQSLEETCQYEASLMVYDHLQEGLAASSPGALMVRIHRAVLALLTDQLVDADDALRRARSTMPAEARGTPIESAYRFARLLQAFRTHRFGEALEELLEERDIDPDASDVWDRAKKVLSPLGVESAYGYAVLAWCADQSGQPALRDRAWQAATILMPAFRLAGRFKEMRAWA